MKFPVSFYKIFNLFYQLDGIYLQILFSQLILFTSAEADPQIFGPIFPGYYAAAPPQLFPPPPRVNITSAPLPPQLLHPYPPPFAPQSPFVGGAPHNYFNIPPPILPHLSHPAPAPPSPLLPPYPPQLPQLPQVPQLPPSSPFPILSPIQPISEITEFSDGSYVHDTSGW